MKEKKNNIEKYLSNISRVRDEISKMIVGQKNIVKFVLIALLSEGHVLIEGVPGLGKTMIIKAFADILNLKFKRIQFTPDLIPSDLLGTSIVTQYNNELKLEFEKGPIFANLILADEINRASPKTQSALLEAMQEKAATIRGIKYEIDSPFLVLATQNPLEMEGTYPLPEAQIDRFLFKIFIHQPDESELVEILDKTTGTVQEKLKKILNHEELLEIQKIVSDVVVEPNVKNFAVKVITSTQPENKNSSEKVKRFIRYGAGPRGAQALILGAKANAFMNERLNVTIEDVKKVAKPALRHRLALNFEGQSEGINVDDMITEIMEELSSQKDGYKIFKETV
jgi:MoxR-like ATPase